MRLHFFSSAVIANSKLDYWPKTTISWWHSHFKGCAMILCLNHGRDLWQRITGHVARLLKHPQGRSFHFPDFVLFIKFPYIWTHSSLPSELFGSPSAQFSYFPFSGVPSIQWNLFALTVTLSNPSHTPDGETKSLSYQFKYELILNGWFNYHKVSTHCLTCLSRVALDLVFCTF